MFSSIPNDFFDVDNMEKLGEMYSKKSKKSPSMDAPAKEAEYEVPNATSYQQTFNLEELRNSYPDASQEKQSIEISLATGQAIITRLKLINGQYAHNTIEDTIDQDVIEQDIQKFQRAGFVTYKVRDNAQILYLTKFNVL